MQDLAQLSQGGSSAFTEAKTTLSPYAAQLLYKSASEPSSADAPAQPRPPPAAVAGVHMAHGGETFAKEGTQPGGSGQRIISYSSEPTNSSSSGLAKFPSEPFGRPHNIVQQFSAFDLPPGEFHSVAWVSIWYPFCCVCRA